MTYAADAATPLADMGIRKRLRFLAAAAGVSLAACGGGGGGGPPPPPPPPPSAPAIAGPSCAGAPSAPATVTLSGIAQYESVPTSSANGRLLYNSITAKPIRGATVEILSAASGCVLASAPTDATGAYSVSIAPTESVRVRVRAQLVGPRWDFRIRDNTRGNAQYVLDSAPMSGLVSAALPPLVAGSGWDFAASSYRAPRAGGVFAILDAVHEAHQKVLSVDPLRVFPPLDLFWSIGNRPVSPRNVAAGFIVTSHFVSFPAPAIYILGAEGADTDEYDTHVVVHEFGHYLQFAASRSDSIGGPHGANDRLDMRVAFSEGWGNAWSGIVLNDPIYRDSLGIAQSSGFTLNVSTPLPPHLAGWYREDSLQYVIWQASQQLGFGPLWQAFTGPIRTADAATGAHLLAFGLKQFAAPGTVDAIFSSQSINTTANDPFGTNETNNGGIMEALPIYRDYTGFGTPLGGLCVTAAAGVQNKLGNYVFVRVTFGSQGPRTIRLTGGTDPDFDIYNPNFVASGISPNAGVEQLTITPPIGSYVIAVHDFAVTTGQVGGRPCLSLTIN